MGFVIGAVVALIVIFLLTYITIKKPVFGEVIIVLSIIMILAATFFYFQKDNRVENKKSLISLEEIKLTDIKHHLAYGNYHKLTANLKNESPRYRLQSINLNLSFFHCPQFNSDSNSGLDSGLKEGSFKDCELLLEKAHEVDTRLPSQQETTIESYVLLDDEIFSSSKSSDDTPQDNKQIHWKVEVVSGVAR